jgi:predicted GH43/DUF377 family glycosyl hydrolase
MYHGAHTTADGPIYRAGLALLDLDDPRIVLRRTDEWLFGPAEPYEVSGDVGRVVFPCGWILDEPADLLTIYYGAADSVIASASARFSDVRDLVAKAPIPPASDAGGDQPPRRETSGRSRSSGLASKNSR